MFGTQLYATTQHDSNTISDTFQEKTHENKQQKKFGKQHKTCYSQPRKNSINNYLLNEESQRGKLYRPTLQKTLVSKTTK